ncbi:MAG: response regulator [Deltaproteobacteria bacterium]|nr:response regulator [Deltaproteobacteria bacterium]
MPKKILIIDDDRDTVDFVERILEDHGYEGIGSLSSASALDTIRAEKPDLILLDLFMPEKSGISLFRELKADPDLEHIPVIVASGIPQVAGIDVSAFIGREAETSKISNSRVSRSPEGVVNKPIEPDMLIGLIREITSQGDLYRR